MSLNKQKGFMSLEAGLAIAVGVLLLVGYGIIRYQHSENQKLTAENATQKITIGTQTETIERDKKSDAVNEQTNTAVTVKTKEADGKQGKVAADTQSQVDAIIREAKAKEAAAKDAEVKRQIALKRINDVSAARIDGIWKSYCLVAPAAEGCAPAPAK